MRVQSVSADGDMDLLEVNLKMIHLPADVVPAKVLRECFDCCIATIRADIAVIFTKILERESITFEKFQVKDDFSQGITS